MVKHQAWDDSDDQGNTKENREQDKSFKQGSVFGMQFDKKRGLLNFFKDGQDLGLAFNNKELR